MEKLICEQKNGCFGLLCNATCDGHCLACDIRDTIFARLQQYESLNLSPSEIAEKLAKITELEWENNGLTGEVDKILKEQIQLILSVSEKLEKLAAREAAEQDGRAFKLPVPVGTVLNIECDSEYPARVHAIGVYISAIEEGEWYEIDDFLNDFKTEIAEAKRALEDMRHG